MQKLLIALIAAVQMVSLSRAEPVDGQWFMNQLPWGYANWNTTTCWIDGKIAGDGGVFTYLGTTVSHDPNWRDNAFYLNQDGVQISGINLPFTPTFTFDGAYDLNFVGERPFLHAKDVSGYLDQKISFCGDNNIFEKTGRSDLYIYPNARYKGFSNILFKHGNVTSYETNDVAITDGNVTFEGNEISFAPVADPDSNVALSLAENGTVALKGAVRFALNKGENTSVVLNIGAIDRTENCPGTLYLAPQGGRETIGETEKFFLNNPNALVHENARMLSPIIVIGGPNSAATTAAFAKYDAEKGVVPAEDLYVDGFDAAGEHSIVRLRGAVTLEEDKTIHALVLENDAILTIESGVTLTVGDGTTPAGIILQNTGTTQERIRGGAIDFRGSEGVIWLQGKSSPEQHLDTEIKGSKGITITGYSAEGLSWTVLKGTYSNAGALRHYWDRLELQSTMTAAQPVWIFGNRARGGQLYYKTTSPIGELHLAGFGYGSAYHGLAAFVGTGKPSGSSQYGSEYINKIVLDDDAAFRMNSPIVFNCPIEGAGGIHMTQDNNPMTLNGINTYQGKTKVDAGSLVLGENGTFGTGDIVNNSSIALNKTSDFTITNAVSGSGSWKSGANKLTFAHPSTVLAALTTRGGIEIAGADMRLGNLSQIPEKTIQPFAEGEANPAMAGIGTAADIVYRGFIQDNDSRQIGLRKIGAGALTITKEQTYSGETIVEEGTLKLNKFRKHHEGVPYQEDVLYHLDAQNRESLVIDEETKRVTEWKDLERDVTFKQRGTMVCPAYSNDVVNSINGKPAIYFDGANTNCLEATQKFSTRTVLVMFRATGLINMGCLWANGSGDSGSRFLRFINAGDNKITIQCAADSSFFYSTKEAMSINGIVNANEFTKHEPTLVSAFRDADISDQKNILGWNYNERAHIGYVGEVIAFNRILERDEIRVVENYMWKKWMEETLHSNITGADGTLPQTTALKMLAGTTFDLNGVDQTVGSLDGEDAVIVNNGESPVTLTVRGANNFRGTIGPNVNLVSKGAANVGLATGDGTLTFEGATTAEVFNSLPPQQDMLYWLDATDADTVQCSENGYVTNWISKAGVEGLSFGLYEPTKWNEAYFPPPTYTGTINDQKAVLFGNTSTNYMRANKTTAVQTLAMVFQTSQNQMSMAGYWGGNGDMGIRGGNASLQYGSGGNPLHGAEAWHNGVKLDISKDTIYYEMNAPVTIHLESRVKLPNYTTSIAGYSSFITNPNDPRLFRGAIGEVIAYSRTLTEEERAQLETYLKRKWRTPGYTVNTQVFADGANVTMAPGATLDVQGQGVTLKTLAGGTITGDVTVTDALTVVLDERGLVCVNPLEVTGRLTLNGCKLIVEGKPMAQNDKIKIAEASGGIVGVPEWENQPHGWSVVPKDNALYLRRTLGTVFILR